MRRIRRHIGFANVVATLALLFAMSGGVFAATGGFASGGTLHACVHEGGGLTLLQSGKHCKHGLKTVSWSIQGPKGAPGTSGPAGVNGVNGATGFTSTLPSGATEVGTWAGDEHTTEETPYYMPISFNIPLASAPEIKVVAKNAPRTEECPGSAAEPKATHGVLCIYVGELFSGTLFEFDPAQNGSGPYGTILGLKPTGTNAIAYGTWAVTG
jgi:hypothetical protein